MQNDSTYEGWSNWETWNVALWADNEYAVYCDRIRTASWDGEAVANFIAIYWPNGTPDMDDTDDGYSAVNWQEIAEHWNAETEE